MCVPGIGVNFALRKAARLAIPLSAAPPARRTRHLTRQQCPSRCSIPESLSSSPKLPWQQCGQRVPPKSSPQSSHPPVYRSDEARWRACRSVGQLPGHSRAHRRTPEASHRLKDAPIGQLAAHWYRARPCFGETRGLTTFGVHAATAQLNQSSSCQPTPTGVSPPPQLVHHVQKARSDRRKFAMRVASRVYMVDQINRLELGARARNRAAAFIASQHRSRKKCCQ